MMDIKKYMTTIGVLLGILLVSGVIVNIFISNLATLFTVIIDITILFIAVCIIFSAITTNRVVKSKKVNTLAMKVNFNIVSVMFPFMSIVANIIGIPKNELRKVYVRLNNAYIYSNSYSINPNDILILIPHCVQKNSCKLKVTTDINTCVRCGKCNIGELAKLKADKGINIFVATGGTLARKIIVENKPKAIIAVACERDLTSGVQDVKKIPVLGVFNKRPNGPCVDTTIDIKEIEEAIEFFTRNSN